MIKNKDEYLIDEEEECINIKVHKLNKNQISETLKHINMASDTLQNDINVTK